MGGQLGQVLSSGESDTPPLLIFLPMFLKFELQGGGKDPRFVDYRCSPPLDSYAFPPGSCYFPDYPLHLPLLPPRAFLCFFSLDLFPFGWPPFWSWQASPRTTSVPFSLVFFPFRLFQPLRHYPPVSSSIAVFSSC